jgi:threonyl-tRNA synthetase
MGIIIEHFTGAFPVWLAPEQVWVLPISDKFNIYGKKVVKELQGAGVRVEIRDENESLGKKIRTGELHKIPYLLVVGEKEAKAENVAVRDRQRGDIGAIKLKKFIEKITKEIERRK